MTSSTANLDLEALMSREYRPSRVTRLVPREAYKPKKLSGEHHHSKKSTPKEADSKANEKNEEAQKQRVETSRLVLQLASQTPEFAQHLPAEEREKTQLAAAALLTESADRNDTVPEKIPSSFHPVELESWESKINWLGCAQPPASNKNASSETAATADGAATGPAVSVTPPPPSSSASDTTDSMMPPPPPPSDAMALLKRPRNPHLDTLQFDSSTVCWSGNPAEFLQKARDVPLILELGVAGQSVAKHVYQNTVLSAQRPAPALQSAAYQKRMEMHVSSNITSTAELPMVSDGKLHKDKAKWEKIIQERQKKRAQMAKDKTNRVTEAMGTLALGGGRGRTITSSLMGPGGTERTGRPTRASHSSAAHDSEYTEQLDMVVNHQLVRDLSKVLLRQYHRPKLPQSVVRQDLSWQLQICYVPSAHSKTGAAKDGTSASYQSMMMAGGGIGSLSKEKLRTEADLTPTEGHLILMEYCEERPPLQLVKGMAWKMVNYYRGDKAHCPVSRGGGDRPARRKRDVDKAVDTESANNSNRDRLPRLGDTTRRETSILDWVGKIPKKTQRVENKESTIDVLPEGRTEILHPKVHGPFIGEVEEGTTLTGCISNLFVAPMFRYDAESTDFLMILTTPGGASRAGQRERMGVVLRDLPSCFTVGQTEPRARVYAPNTQGEKSFIGPFVSYQIARSLARAQTREGHGLRFDELQARVLPNLELAANQLRQRLKQVAIYDKNTQIWTSKAVGYEDYPGVEALGKMSPPERVAAFEAACAASRRLSDLGIHQLLERGSHTVTSVGVSMVYVAGQLGAARELARKTKKLLEVSKSNKSIQRLQAAYYEKAANELENLSKALRQKYEVAKFIYEELQLAPWHLTGEFLDVHKKGEGTGMMKLTGLGDPSGRGEGFSFLREADTKPSKSAVGNEALSDEVKKITGTEDDLRKLTMKQMASLLRSYGMAQKQIDTLKRWDRVHVIRDLSTKAASDGIGDGLERFARGEKMKLSEQKQMYRDRVQVIWKRQLAVLSMKGQAADSGGAPGDNDAEDPASAQPAQPKADIDNDDSDDSDDDLEDLAAEMEDQMMDRTAANQLVAQHRGDSAENAAPSRLRAMAQDQDTAKDARELAALQRQREEERQAKEGLQSTVQNLDPGAGGGLGANKKVIRKRITKTHPDGRQTTTFKFILQPAEVGKIMDKLQNTEQKRSRNKDIKYERGVDEKPPGHAMFEDEDDFEYSSKGRSHGGGRRGGGRGRRGGRTTPRGRNLQLGKLKTRISKEDRMRKRKRDEEELEVYSTAAKRKGTSNRRERGSIRDRRPHVIYAEKLEAIRAAAEARPNAGPFKKPVNRKLIPRYYEVISHPIDLLTIRNRISAYEYRSADVLLRDFELMKNNSIKFNGEASPITVEAKAIYEFVKDRIENSRSELTELEAAVEDQMSSKTKKKKKGAGTKKSSASTSGQVANLGGVDVNLGDLRQNSMGLEGVDSDSGDESFSGLMDL